MVRFTTRSRSGRGRLEPKDNKEAVSDVQFFPGTDSPELISIPARPRRFARLPGARALQPRRPDRIEEGAALAPVNLREGLYRRSLAIADASAALLALCLIVVWDAGARFDPWVLLAMPVVVLVSKVGGLYERDELVLRKTHARRGAVAAADRRDVRPDRPAIGFLNRDGKRSTHQRSGR